MIDERLLAEIAAAMQGVRIPAERVRRAAGVVAPINERIAAAALLQLAFDDRPSDFAALLKRSALTP